MIDWCSVPAGPFTMGSDVAAAYPPDVDETPRRLVTLAPFRIARTPVTNPQSGRFVAETGRAWRQTLTEAGFDAVLTSDWPVDEYGHGDISLRVPPGRGIEAEESLEPPE